jgi:hypothetical protein
VTYSQSAHPLSGGSRPAPAPAEVVRESADASEPVDAEPVAELSECWQQVVAEITRRKALLGSVLQHAAPLEVADGVLTVGLTASTFHAEMLADRANRDLINQAVRQHVPGARRFEVGTGRGSGSGARRHPAVQAALSVFQGEVVAVRPRVPEEGERQ